MKTVFMKTGGRTYAACYGGGPQFHSPGIPGGLIWMAALGLNVIASGVADLTISFALGQGLR